MARLLPPALAWPLSITGIHCFFPSSFSGSRDSLSFWYFFHRDSKSPDVNANTVHRPAQISEIFISGICWKPGTYGLNFVLDTLSRILNHWKRGLFLKMGSN